jgi:hypothetical protein
LALIAALTGPASAQPARAPGMAYDPEATVMFKAHVVSVDWTLPRVRIHVIEDENGQAWMIEGDTPNGMLRVGIPQARLGEGTAILVRGWRAQDRRCLTECKAVAAHLDFLDAEGRVIRPPSLHESLRNQPAR